MPDDGYGVSLVNSLLFYYSIACSWLWCQFSQFSTVLLLHSLLMTMELIMFSLFFIDGTSISAFSFRKELPCFRSNFDDKFVRIITLGHINNT